MNYAVVGVGALGKRHLQSLNQLKDGNEIYAVEINDDVINELKKEMPWVHFASSVSKLPKKLSTVVLATGSNVRRMLFEQLISSCSVDNIIFEKVLFQTESDYYYAKEKISELGISAWVNCSRREWDAYKELKTEIHSANELYFSAIGGNWGMGCNAIHMLDLIEFLAEDKVEKLDISGLQNKIVESKRKGYYEFFGTIKGQAGRCRDFTITCIEDSQLPFIIEVVTELGRYIISETQNVIKKSTLQQNWNWKEEEFRPVYQSQMTGRVVRTIVESGECNLSKYEDSMQLHLKYIIPLIQFFNKNGMEGEKCPIT